MCTSVFLLYPERPTSLLRFPGNPTVAAGTGWPEEKQGERKSIFVWFYNTTAVLAVFYCTERTMRRSYIACELMYGSVFRHVVLLIWIVLLEKRTSHDQNIIIINNNKLKIIIINSVIYIHYN